MDLSSDEGMEAGWKHRMGECQKVAGALKNVWKRRKVTTKAKMSMYNGVIFLSVLYGNALDMGDKCRIENEGDVFEMGCLRPI